MKGAPIVVGPLVPVNAAKANENFVYLPLSVVLVDPLVLLLLLQLVSLSGLVRSVWRTPCCSASQLSRSAPLPCKSRGDLGHERFHPTLSRWLYETSHRSANRWSNVKGQYQLQLRCSRQASATFLPQCFSDSGAQVSTSLPVDLYKWILVPSTSSGSRVQAPSVTA